MGRIPRRGHSASDCLYEGTVFPARFGVDARGHPWGTVETHVQDKIAFLRSLLKLAYWKGICGAPEGPVRLLQTATARCIISTNETPQPADPEALLVGLLHQAEALVLNINEGLARLRNTDYRVPGETDDHAAYRKHRVVSGPLSELGEQVMLALLKLGLTDDQVGDRMSISSNGVGVRRRKWGRAYGQKG